MISREDGGAGDPDTTVAEGGVVVTDGGIVVADGEIVACAVPAFHG
jgi:hypothetical protein